VIRAGDRSAYLARTTLLRRRLLRVMKMWNLGSLATGIDYCLTGSSLESSLVHYWLARRLFPGDYAKRVKLRFPAYVKLLVSNPFPRTHITSRLTGGDSIYYGPFRSRQAAEQFEARCLDLFQVRRCQEDLDPRPEHPGCIYGEMNLCLRPCQAVVSQEEYRSEAGRLADFLSREGFALLNAARGARDRLSEEMNFEEAARQHKRLERIQAVLGMRDELAHDLGHLNGVAVAGSADPGIVNLWFLSEGWWQPPVAFPLNELSGSLDRRLRDIVEGMQRSKGSVLERQEHLALLAAWRYSSFSSGEWVYFEDFRRVPYRKLVNAIARMHGLAG
jgi:excinuclease UvrABC nuclease subunit